MIDLSCARFKLRYLSRFHTADIILDAHRTLGGPIVKGIPPLWSAR